MKTADRNIAYTLSTFIPWNPPMNENPYAPPKADLDRPDTDAEAIRTAHISHEASIKGVGLLYFLVGAGALLGGLTVLMVGSGPEKNPMTAFSITLLMLVVGGASLVLGYGLRRLKRWVRIPVGIFSALGLLNFPIGTLLNAYILYLIFSAKGRTILSDEYAEVVALTPDIRYRTSIVVWILLALLLGLVVLAFAVPFFSQHR